MSFDYADLERRIAALEASQSASLRFGRVTGVSGGKVRVELPDGQNVNSYELSTIQKRVLKDQDIKMPYIGEPVACLFSGQGREQGLVLGAYYNGQENAPEQPAHIDYRKYSDGTEIFYDREKHRLYARVMGDAVIETEKSISAKAKQEILAESSTKITLRAPDIYILGHLHAANVDGGATTGNLIGNYSVTGGNITVPDGDVSAGSVSLRGHQHNNSGGSGVGGTPVGG